MDWEAIEREYRASQLSVKEIARRNGCSRAAIQKKAKQKGWTRDLSDQVRREVAVKVAARSTQPAPTITDEEIIDAASDRGAAVIEGHLARASRLKRIADRMAEGLERHMGLSETPESEVHPEYPLLRNYPGFALFVAKSDGPASILKCLADVTERIARLERTALNLDDAPPATETEILIEID